MYSQPLSIGSVPIGMPAVQAALSGYSDLPMRTVAREHSWSWAMVPKYSTDGVAADREASAGAAIK